MYKVVFEYANGKKGVCIENGKPCLFETEQKAKNFADNLNSKVSEDMKPFFPVWYAEEMKGE